MTTKSLLCGFYILKFNTITALKRQTLQKVTLQLGNDIFFDNKQLEKIDK